MLDMDWINFVIIILASFRLTRLIVFDEIAAFVRNPFIKVTYEKSDDGELFESIEVKGSGLRHWIGKLLSCHWCVGIWSAIITVVIFKYLTMLYPLLLILAVAGAAAIIQTKLEE